MWLCSVAGAASCRPVHAMPIVGGWLGADLASHRLSVGNLRCAWFYLGMMRRVCSLLHYVAVLLYTTYQHC
jgi:hypothetical protein